MHYPYDVFASIMNWLKLVMLQTGNASNRVISALHIFGAPHDFCRTGQTNKSKRIKSCCTLL